MHSRNVVLKEAFEKTHSDMLQRSFEVEFSGTTAVTVLILGHILICANSGDSRAIVASISADEWSITQLSVDQKPDLKNEYNRIIKSNGRVECYKGNTIISI